MTDLAAMRARTEAAELPAEIEGAIVMARYWLSREDAPIPDREARTIARALSRLAFRLSPGGASIVTADPVQPDSGETTEALVGAIHAVLPSMGMTSFPDAPTKPAQANAAHKALRQLRARLAEAEAQRDEAREFAGDKQTSLVRQWREQAEAAERRVAALEAERDEWWRQINETMKDGPDALYDLILDAKADSLPPQPAQPGEPVGHRLVRHDDGCKCGQCIGLPRYGPPAQPDTKEER